MIIDVAVIAPLGHLADLAARGSIDMALTHLVLTHADYARHYAGQAAAGRTVILDNGAFELEETTGAGMPAAPVMRAANLIGATDVVCTDVLYDGPRTVTSTRRFLAEAADHASDVAGDVRFMGVPQGRTRPEWLACYQTLATMDGIDLIGISKLSVPRCWGGEVARSRLACVAELHHRGPPPKPLHLLGGDRSLPAELRRHRELGHHAVHSNDSSTATWYAALGLTLDPRTGRAERQALGKPDLAGTRLTPEQCAIAHANITTLRDHAGLPAHTAAMTEGTR